MLPLHNVVFYLLRIKRQAKRGVFFEKVGKTKVKIENEEKDEQLPDLQ